MRINQQSTAIDCFHGRVQHDKAHQQASILAVMELGKVYTGQELYRMTGLVPGTISARLKEMREQGDVIRKDKKICPHSGVLVFTHAKVPVQLELAA